MGEYVPLEDWANKEKRTFTTPDTQIPVQVEERFDKCEEFAQKAFENSQDFVNNLDHLLTDLQTRSIFGPGSLPGAMDNVPNSGITPKVFDLPPDLGDITGLFTDIPTDDTPDPMWVKVTPITVEDVPPFNEIAPRVTAIAPVHDSITPPGDPDPLETIDYPTEPDEEKPVPPEPPFPILFPPAIDIKIEPFDKGLEPTWSSGVPENFSYTEADYGSDIWADLLAKVLNDIRNGGTGLGALVEEELYNRALARQETENERLYQEVENYFEARGFTLPVGAMAGRLAEAVREVSRNNTEINSKITIDQAQLAQTNTHFMIDKGVQLEGMLRDFFNQQATRLLDASKTIATLGIEIFNTEVNKFNAEVQLHQARGAIYESKVKASLIEANIYKTQIEACGVKADVEKNVVARYAESVKAYKTNWEIYTTAMDASKTKAAVEKIKIENFRALVEAYIARIEADKAKFVSYGLELEGSHTEALIYSEQIKAHALKIENAKASAEIDYKVSDLDLKLNREKTEQYKALLDGYSTEVNAIDAGNTKLLDAFKAEATAYSAETTAYGLKWAAQIKQMDVFVNDARLKLDEAIAKSQAALGGFKAVKELQVAGTKGIMDVGAQLAASAMNAINANASLGFAQHTSEGETWGHHETISEAHPYEEVKIAEGAPEEE